MSALARSQPSSSAVEKVLIGTATAPIRAAPSHAATKSMPVGKRMPTCVPASDADPDQSAGDVEGRVRRRRRT